MNNLSLQTKVDFDTDENGIAVFMDCKDSFYEGAYTATSKWLPRMNNWIFKLPLVLLNSGYVRQVGLNVKKSSTVLELGCGGGISYLNQRFNMIGLDVSYLSLVKAPYPIKIQARAEAIPLEDNSIDAVISCSFWEHIDSSNKATILKEVHRVLKPGGKVIFFYDVQTDNKLINTLKKDNSELYHKVFIEKDGHLGYHTPKENAKIFSDNGFKVIKHFGKERTNFLALSAVQKLIETNIITGWKAPIFLFFNKSPFIHLYYFFLHLVDNTLGRLSPVSKSRVILTIAQKTS